MSRNVNSYEFKQQDVVNNMFLIVIKKNNRRKFNA